MGWTGMYPPSHRDKKQWLIDEFTSDNENFRSTITDLSVRGGQAYGIYHQEDKKTGISLHEAMVFLISCRKDEWAYKVMGETVHPYYYKAPKTLLDKLQVLYPPFNDNAMKWRQKCREELSKKKVVIQDGNIVKFDSPISFGWFTEQIFTVVKHGKKTSFRTKNGTLCRITNWKDREFKVIADVNEILTEWRAKNADERI